MRFIECKQGTPEWHASRNGLITASRFHTVCNLVGELDEKQAKYVKYILQGMGENAAWKEAGYAAAPKAKNIIAAIKGEKYTDYSEEAKKYAGDLALERISGKQYGEPPKAWILERGHEMEHVARQRYEKLRNVYVTEAGICVDDHGFGYSSDGLVDEDGLIEIKALTESGKLEEIYRTGDLSEFMHQMQGGMWLTGRKWCDFILYVPALESTDGDLYIKRVHRDDEFIDDMAIKLAEFGNIVNAKEAFFRSIKNEPSQALPMAA